MLAIKYVIFFPCFIAWLTLSTIVVLVRALRLKVCGGDHFENDKMMSEDGQDISNTTRTKVVKGIFAFTLMPVVWACEVIISLIHLLSCIIALIPNIIMNRNNYENKCSDVLNDLMILGKHIRNNNHACSQECNNAGKRIFCEYNPYTPGLYYIPLSEDMLNKCIKCKDDINIASQKLNRISPILIFVGLENVDTINELKGVFKSKNT